MSAQHTPGPWQVSGSHVYTADPERALLAQVLNPGSKASDFPLVANARLIAAAPELLAVAQFFLRGIEGGHIKCAAYIDFDPNAEKLEIKSPADRLRDAIAKATGSAT